MLAVEHLRTAFHTPDGVVRAVDDVSWTLARGEILGVVGESGCGKSVTALSVMGLVPDPPGRVEGSIRLDGRELVGLAEAGDAPHPRQRHLDGVPGADDVARSGHAHRKADRRAARSCIRVSDAASAKARAIELLRRVRIPEAERRADEYPHQLSGGMRQRVMIAMALACRPAVLLADEPTTALDVTIQAQILRLILELRREFGTAIVLITHDLGVIAETADRVVVMYAGRKVEEAPVARSVRAAAASLHGRAARLGAEGRPDRAAPAQAPGRDCRHGAGARPRDHRLPLRPALPACDRPVPPRGSAAGNEAARPYRGLLACGARAGGGRCLTRPRKTLRQHGAPLLAVENLVKHFPVRGGIFGRAIAQVHAVDGVSFTLRERETLGIVGESGCGKSTLARMIVRLIDPTGGDHPSARHRYLDALGRRHAALPARHPVRVPGPLRVAQSAAARRRDRGRGDREFRDRNGARRSAGAWRRCSPASACGRRRCDNYPHEFSGGQRQRLGIARALALNPNIIVADEPVSALDVSVQAQVINLMIDLQQEFGIAYLFIAHDLAVVQHISHRVAVMYLGRIVEIAPRDALFTAPLHPYTEALLDSVPIPDPALRREKDVLVGRSAEPDAPAARLPLPYALPAGAGALPDRGARDGRDRAGSFRRLPRARTRAACSPSANEDAP